MNLGLKILFHVKPVNYKLSFCIQNRCQASWEFDMDSENMFEVHHKFHTKTAENPIGHRGGTEYLSFVVQVVLFVYI